MPRSALGSFPVISHVMVVGEDSDSCSNVTVPVIFESPRTVATTNEEHQISMGQELLIEQSDEERGIKIYACKQGG
jgi:hypothetical protein